MKLRGILLVLALLAILSVSVSGAVYIYSLRESTLRNAVMQAATQTAAAQSRLDLIIAQSLKSVHALSRMPDVENLLVSPQEPEARRRADHTLDRFCAAMDDGVCYVMDQTGMTVAATNRDRPDGFLGKNYEFRPYFRMAMLGEPYVYMALGVTSGRRGIYFSHPVRGPDGDPVGAAVIKEPVDELESTLAGAQTGEMVLIDPHGVVFLSSRPEWLYHTFWPIDQDIENKIEFTRQFGDGPWPWLGLSRRGPDRVLDQSGQEYLVSSRPIQTYPGWELMYLRDYDMVMGRVSKVMIQSAVYTVALLILVIGAAAFWLYRSGSVELAARSRAEAALKRSEERFRGIVENSQEGILIVDDQYRFIYVNDEMCHILGYSREQILNADFRDFLTPEDQKRVGAFYVERQSGQETPTRYEMEVVRKSGEIRLLELSASVVLDADGRPQTVAVVLDVTERKKTEQALIASEKKYRTILETMEEGYFETNLAGFFTYVNDAGCRIVGYGREQLLRMNQRDYTDSETSSRIETTFNHIFQTGQPEIILDYPIFTQAGRTRILEVSAGPLKDDHGDIIGFSGLARDVTERKRAEEALRESEERYRAVLESNPDPVVIYDMDGNVVYFNPSFTRVFGWTLDERIGHALDDFVPKEAWSETRRMIERVLAGRSFSGVESIRRTKDGRVLPVSISGAIFSDPNGRPIGSVINIRDVSEQRRLESQLRHAQKMEAVGTLASGIAHDFNNLLQAISGYIQLLNEKYSHDATPKRYLEEVDLAVNRAAELVQRLLTFSRKVTPQLAQVDLAGEIQRTVGLLERTLPKMVRIETWVEPDLWPVRGDANQLQQLLMNLAANAKDAMADGGRLTITARNRRIDDRADDSDPAPGDWVVLEMADTGSGMDEETLSHVFEPFFTTKPVGQGTGLGLASSYGIVKAHQGEIYCESQTGDGATFTVFLPADPDAPPVGEADQGEPLGAARGRETILIVDDEPAIRDIAQEMLTLNGYQTRQAVSGEEAISMYQANGRDISLVLLDLGMPGMGGQACLKRLLEIDPVAKVVIASGYASDEYTRAALDLGAAGFIPKPYRLRTLLGTIRSVLDQ